MESKYTVKSSFEKPKKIFPTHTSEFMNKVNENAKGTDPKYVGVIDELFYEFYDEALKNGSNITPEAWKSFHKEKRNTKKGKKAVKAKLKEMKSAIRSITNEMIEEWYDFFVYEQTFYGKHQEFLIKDYFDSLGINVEMRRSTIKKNKIDLLVGNIPCQVKPFDSRNPSRNRPIEKDVTYIYYEKGENITFYWDSPELDELIKKQEEKNNG